MPMPKSLSSYEDIRNYMDRALESEKGIRLKVGIKGDAVQVRQKLYTCRSKVRAQNMTVYPPGHPMHGVSPYDILIMSLDQIGDFWSVEIRKGEMLEVEEL